MAQDAGGTWTRRGAVVSAALASMCCILPLGVSYERSCAEVRVREERPPEVSQLLAAVDRSGYFAQVSE